MLRENMMWWLLRAAINGNRPKFMTPEETDFFESYYAGIQKDRAEGKSYVYDIPTSYPDHGIDFHVKGIPDEKSKVILAIEKIVVDFYEAGGLWFEDGMADLLPAEREDMLVFARYMSDRIWLPVNEETGIPEYIRYIAYTFTAGLIENYAMCNDRAFPLIEDLISRTMELVILRYFAEKWEKLSGKIPGANETDRERLKVLVSAAEAGKMPLKVREIGTVDFDWQKTQPVSRLIRSAGEKTVKERQKAAARMADLFREDDLEPMIRIRQYYTKDRRLMADWISKNYPESKLFGELIRTVGKKAGCIL